MTSPPAGFGQAGVELRRRGPGPARPRISGGAENVLILFAFAFRPGLDEHEQLGARHAVGELETVGRQLVAGRLPFLARPGGQEFKLIVRQFHGATSST